MYQRILVPVDASAQSERAIEASIGLARQLGAAITGFVAAQPERAHQSTQAKQASARLRRVETSDLLSPADAHGVLARFAAAAQAAGVPFEGQRACLEHGDATLLAQAEASGCDLLVMVSEGRGAFGEYLYGSQTKAVLAGSKLPLLVLH